MHDDDEEEDEVDGDDDGDDDDEDDGDEDFDCALSNSVTSLLMVRRDSSSHTISPNSFASRRKISRNERNLFEDVCC